MTELPITWDAMTLKWRHCSGSSISNRVLDKANWYEKTKHKDSFMHLIVVILSTFSKQKHHENNWMYAEQDDIKYQDMCIDGNDRQVVVMIMSKDSVVLRYHLIPSLVTTMPPNLATRQACFIHPKFPSKHNALIRQEQTWFTIRHVFAEKQRGIVNLFIAIRTRICTRNRQKMMLSGSYKS